MLSRLQDLANSISAELSATHSSITLSIKRVDGISFEFIVPTEVLEWFMEASINGEKVWSDWADYYSTQGESEASLRAEMYEDIENFSKTVAAAPIRSTTSIRKTLLGFKKSQIRKLEWFVDDQWSEVSLLNLPRLPTATSQPAATT